MNKSEFNYFIANGEHAVKFLEELSNTGKGRKECNTAFNHAMCVSQVVRMAKLYFTKIEGLEAENKALKLTIKNLQQGEYQELLNKDRKKLQAEFENLKNALTQFILDYPDNDNY